MALGDFYVADPRGQVLVSTRYLTKANQTSINAGEFVVQDTDGADQEYVVQAPDGASSSNTWVGVAATTDTVTSTADGQVYVYDDPQYIFRGNPTTSGNLADSLINTVVTLDNDGTNQTVDENDTSNGTLIIRDYNSTNGTIDVQMTSDDHISSL